MYYLLSYFRDTFENLVPSGSKYKEINTRAISEFAIPLPPLNIQQQIVAECEAVDAEAAAAQASIVTARNKVESMASDAYTKYPLRKLGSVCEKPEYGAAEKAVQGNSQLDYRYIRITDINEDGLLNSDFKTAEAIEQKYILQEGDFLFARSGNTVGKSFLYKQEFGKAIYAGYLIRFRTLREILYPEFLALVTKSKIYHKWVAQKQTGAGQPNINGQIYSSLEIPVPPIADQQRLVAEIEALERTIAAAQTVIAAAPARKQAIMQRYL